MAMANPSTTETDELQQQGQQQPGLHHQVQAQQQQQVNQIQAAAFEMLMNSIASLMGPVVQQLLNSDPNLVHLKGWHGMTALHRACLIGDYNIVLMLLQANSDVNSVTDFNETPLHYASKRGSATVVHLLLQCGAKHDARDNRGRTALHHAAESGVVNIFKYFDDAFGADTKDLDLNRTSPLHLACTHGHVDLFRYLLKNGRSDPLQEDSKGNLAIHITAESGFGHMTWRLLTIHGVSVIKRRNHAGHSPLDLALQHDRPGNHEVVKLLQYYVNQPEHTALTGPVYTWYYLLLYPFVFYAVLVLIMQQLDSHQFVVLLLGAVLTFFQLRDITHRMNHCSRWANPFFMGFFYGGILHTTICYMYNLFPYFSGNMLLVALCFVFIPALHFVYFKLLRVDPGVISKSVLDPKTGRPVTFVDLCMMRDPPYRFCVSCDIITEAQTKHCKLCDRCFYHLDHHCLYLLRCIAVENHPLFLWLIILAFLNMVAYMLAFTLFIQFTYQQESWMELCYTIFHKEAWMASLFLLNLCSAFWCANLIQYQFQLVTRGRTVFFNRHPDGVRPYKLSFGQTVANFIHFLTYKPLPHGNFNRDADNSVKVKMMI